MDEKKSSRKWIWFVFPLVLALWVGSWLLINKWSDWEDRARFGDMFGAVNALFSGLAFAAVFVTLVVQRKELREQRETMQRQQFEATFFNLLNSLLEHRNIIEESGAGSQKGEVFSKHANDLVIKLANSGTEVGDIKEEASPNNPFRMFWKSYKTRFSTFCGLFASIIRYIDESKPQSKTIYIDVVKSHIRHSELVILYYYGLSLFEKTEIKEIIERFGFMEGINQKIRSPEDAALAQYGRNTKRQRSEDSLISHHFFPTVGGC
jgi:hypothetical protein